MNEYLREFLKDNFSLGCFDVEVHTPILVTLTDKDLNRLTCIKFGDTIVVNIGETHFATYQKCVDLCGSKYWRVLPKYV